MNQTRRQSTNTSQDQESREVSSQSQYPQSNSQRIAMLSASQNGSSLKSRLRSSFQLIVEGELNEAKDSAHQVANSAREIGEREREGRVQ